MKTRKIVAKRFNISKNGKVMRRCQNTRHLRSHKSKRQMRNLSQIKIVDPGRVASIKSFLPYL